jgi:predicted nucleotidyltransferase
MDAVLQYCLDELKGRHACHAVLLYGSHARGDATPASDFDLVGFSERASSKTRDARVHLDRYLDLFVFPESEYKHPQEKHLYMRGSKILLDEKGEGARFLAALDRLHATPPAPLPDDEKQARRTWARKMLDRAAQDDLEGRYRLAWLKMALLEDYFALRDLRYPGSKAAFLWLARNDAVTLSAFEHALSPQANVDDLRSLIDRL